MRTAHAVYRILVPSGRPGLLFRSRAPENIIHKHTLLYHLYIHGKQYYTHNNN